MCQRTLCANVVLVVVLHCRFIFPNAMATVYTTEDTTHTAHASTVSTPPLHAPSLPHHTTAIPPAFVIAHSSLAQRRLQSIHRQRRHTDPPKLHDFDEPVSAPAAQAGCEGTHSKPCTPQQTSASRHGPTKDLPELPGLPRRTCEPEYFFKAGEPLFEAAVRMQARLFAQTQDHSKGATDPRELQAQVGAVSHPAPAFASAMAARRRRHLRSATYSVSSV